MTSAEADESYTIGGYRLAIEVNFTSGSEAKLSRYAALGVNEVWFWENSTLRAYHLRAGQYQSVNRSLIPALAAVYFQAMAECILLGETSRLSAVKRFKAAHSQRSDGRQQNRD